MRDSFGREIDYLRVSLTDLCNLRCIYCMPEEGLVQLSHNEILSYEELQRLIGVFAKLGVSKIKLTGGEPLIKKDLPLLVKNIKEIDGIKNITLTTNAVLLDDKIEKLHNAGIECINISMDAIDPETYKKMSGFDYADSVLKTIDNCLSYNGLGVKVNCVPIKGYNENQLVEVAKLAKDRPISVRFIELMPIGYGRELTYMNEQQVLSTLSQQFGKITPTDVRLGNGPSRYYKVDGFAGHIGFISAVSHSFCDQCNRVRLTADGFLKTCLQYDTGVSLREILRSGADDDAVAEAIEIAMQTKPKSHQFLSDQSAVGIEHKPMSKIGG